jgi:hypothetical protein
MRLRTVAIVLFRTVDPDAAQLAESNASIGEAAAGMVRREIGVESPASARDPTCPKQPATAA